MSVFNSPSVHFVERIGAKTQTFVSGGDLVSNLTLKFFVDRSHLHLGKTEGEMDVYAGGEQAEKFERIAAFINHVFADEPSDEAEKLGWQPVAAIEE